MAQKSEEIMPDPDAIIRLRRDRLLGANLTGCDVNFCWMIQIQKKCQALWSVSPRPWINPKNVCKNYRGPWFLRMLIKIYVKIFYPP